MLTYVGRLEASYVLWRVSLVLLLSVGWVGTQAAQSSAQRCAITGGVTSGNALLPGVAITATTDGREVAVTATEPSGAYDLRLPGPGSYAIRAELPAFARITRQVVLTPEACTTRLNLSLVLASRAPAPPPSGAAPAPAGQTTAPPVGKPGAPAQNAAAGRNPGAGVAAGAGRGRGGFQQLDVVESATGAEATAPTTEESVEALRSQLQLPPGFSTDAPTETVATAGNQGQLNEALLFGGRGGREGGPEGFESLRRRDRPRRRGGSGRLRRCGGWTWRGSRRFRRRGRTVWRLARGRRRPASGHGDVHARRIDLRRGSGTRSAASP